MKGINDMAARLQKAETQIENMQLWQQSMVEWRHAVESQTEAIKSMVELFIKIENSLWLFVKIGNGIKYILTLGAVVYAAWNAFKLYAKLWVAQ